eukprot:PITA_30097
MVDKVVELLHEYQDLFPTKITEVKGILSDLGMMKITLKPDVKLVKERPYQANPKYKAKFHEELDKMLEAGIIELVEESESVCPMVVQEKNRKEKFASVWTLGSSTMHALMIHSQCHLQKKYWKMLGDRKPTPLQMVYRATFKEFIHKCLEIALNIKKCTFLIPFGNLLNHVVRKQGLMVDPENITVILNLQAPQSVKQLRAMLGHTGYYRKFIKSYMQIMEPMEQLLKKDATYCWNEEGNKSLEMFKEKMASTPY